MDVHTKLVDMNHHYIPIFLLSKWHDAHGKLNRWIPIDHCLRPVAGTVLHRKSVSAKSAGFIKDLYIDPISIVSYEHAHRLEIDYFQKVDNAAAPILEKMLGAAAVIPMGQDRWQWLEFMRSLQHRTSEGLVALKTALTAADVQFMSELKTAYADRRGAEDPETWEAFVQQERQQNMQNRTLGETPHIITHPGIAEFMYQMDWKIRVFSRGDHLMISDDPIIRSNGLGNILGHIAMPISPRHILMLANGPVARSHIDGIPDDSLIRQMNEWTVEGARRFVVAKNKSQEPFIRDRFGSFPKQSWIEAVAEQNWAA